ncbi:glycosyltransferase family protein [Flavobacterium sp. K5-23]|uniref:glycosyltransferase family protein n=1 Tax=Flavobacterium sp. K5-23 TaxID=2746225 RepID=UPI00200E0DC8|nr:glycosyltransferase family protein [Flavobacterium sp. K5-23]
MEKIKVAAIIQARRGSTRLPDKVFLELAGKPLLEHVVLRLKVSSLLDEIIIATTVSANDDFVELWANNNNIKFFRGSEENVLERYYQAAKEYNVDIIVRITADDPFKDVRLIDEAVNLLIENNLDFVCNNSPVSFPEGLDVEVMTFEALEKSYKNAVSDFDKEHVTQYIHKNKNNFNVCNIQNDKDLSSYRWTLDTFEDYEFAKKIYSELYKEGEVFLREEMFNILEEIPSIMELNNKVKRSDLYR